MTSESVCASPAVASRVFPLLAGKTQARLKSETDVLSQTNLILTVVQAHRQRIDTYVCFAAYTNQPWVHETTVNAPGALHTVTMESASTVLAV